MYRFPIGGAATLLALVLAFPLPAHATQWVFDPSVLVADSRTLLLRAPDHEIDRLLQAVHGSAQSPTEAAALCAAFDPNGELGLEALQTAGEQLAPASRERFVAAITSVVIAAAQHQPQPFDETQARQALKAAGVSAAIQHDGFSAGLNGTDRDARCRSVGQLIDGLQAQPLPNRAAATRLLLMEGISMIAPTLQP
ncbi:MAG: hypothetical protein H0T88_09745 [Lysobacter sp.]|nr:hypothetical protein [Lysobacter sp.]